MENTEKNNLPNNRDDFAKRYGISKKTFYRWLKRAKVENEIPEIHQIGVFNRNQSSIIIKKFG